MTASPIGASPHARAAGSLIEYCTPGHGTAVRKPHNEQLQGKGSSKKTVTAFACKCETSYHPRDSHGHRYCTSTTSMEPQTLAKDDVKPAKSRTDLNTMELPRLVMTRDGPERACSPSPSTAGTGVDNISWPSRRGSAQQATDSVISLLTPATRARASQLRGVQTAENEGVVFAPPPMHPKKGTSQGPPQGFSQGRPEGPPGGPPGSYGPYPSLPKTILIMLSLYVSIFLVALDRTILGPAIPSITNQFNSLEDIGWYSSAYMLTSCGFILLYGRIYTFFPTKPAFLTGIALFEIGSAICGAAQNSLMLIIGRAVAGLGSSGVFTGAILIMMNTVPLHKRPLLQGLFGACFGVASVTGPLLGGAFTESGLTWRWCFYINLPLGAITIVVIMFLLKIDDTKPPRKGWKDTVRKMDPLGTILFLPGITCLLLALEWVATEDAWNSPRIIILLTVFAILFTAFLVWQYITRNTTATVPARILFQRSIGCGCASQLCVGATMLTISIYMPLWFQAIRGDSPFQSGSNSLPLVLSTVFASILSGGLIQRLGYYTPFMIFGACCMAVGTGLITTLTTHTKDAQWIGYLIVLGVGVGNSMQHANLAVQAILERRDIPIGTAMLSLCQTLGGAVFTAVGQNLYISKFSEGLKRIHGIDVGHILGAGATELTKGLAPEVRGRVLEAYNDSLTQGTFLAVLFVACLAIPAAMGMEWRSVKKDVTKPGPLSAKDLEMNDTFRRESRRSIHSDRRTSRKDGIRLDDGDIVAPPAPAWKKMHRPSGHFSQWITAKVNPDLRTELAYTK
ncbi:MFS general substrate transporter [Didymella exigua CBS 183.55]|uniref:MFS general substrate transporter n=1 Tax=Didymella exigua CBS 183.55 TaxID=1150837 RepID=A0A6A5RD23_9PLEO|nr:MFS general substrate transporter [Didymella exigua CBS 183.55]KAF1926151.1 MFS general substrate transporter [Didymella exigua CBS 183.55]